MSQNLTRMSSMTARAGLLAWIGVPTLVSLLGLLIYVAPLRVLGHSLPMPLFPLMAIFFWAMAKPKLMPPLVVFAIGLVQDFLTGGPLGLWSFAYLTSYGIMTTQSEAFFGRSGGLLWLAFGLMVLFTLLAAVLAGTLMAGRSPDWPSLLAQGLATFLFYPIMGRLYGRLQRATGQARRMYDFHRGRAH